MSDKTEQLHDPVTDPSQPGMKGENPAQTIHQHDDAGVNVSTDDWLSHLKSPAKESGQGPIIREMPGYEDSEGDNHQPTAGPAEEAGPKMDHKIKRTDNIGETMEAQAQMALYAMSLPPKFGAWAITKEWDDPRTRMDDELKGFLMQVMKPVIAKRRNIFSDEVFFYAGVLVYLVWCVSTIAIIWKDKKAQEAKEKEIKAKEEEIALLKEKLEEQRESYMPNNNSVQSRGIHPQQQQGRMASPPIPQKTSSGGLKLRKPVKPNSPQPQRKSLYRIGETPGKNRAANRDKYLMDDEGKYCYPPIDWKGSTGLAGNGIIMKENRVGELVFLADIDDMDYIVYENRVKKGGQKGEVAYNRIFKAFQNQYPADQLDKLRNLINFHVEMQQEYLGMG